MTPKQYWKKYWIWIIMAIGLTAFWLLYQGRLPPVVLDRATGIVIAVFTVMTMGKFVDIGFKHVTPKLIYPGGFTTTCGDFKTAGNFALFTKGDIKTPVIGYWHGREGTIIIPLTAINKDGDSIALTAKPYLTVFDELPDEIKKDLINNNMPKPYYVGYADIEQYGDKVDIVKEDDINPNMIGGLTKPTIGHLIAMTIQNNRLITFLKSRVAESYGTTEQIVEASSRISERAKGTLFDRIREEFTKEK